MAAYYNEIDKFAAGWLRELIKAGLIADGDVDERSIEDVLPDELAPYRQCHFFAGIGGWSHALRLAGWPDDRRVWTGSAPCQPFSAAGQRAGVDDDRHLWPAFYWLIQQCKPPVVFGEQVSGPLGLGWWDIVATDLENAAYAGVAFDIPAAGVGAFHKRQRLYWVAHANQQQRDWSGFARARRGEQPTDGGLLANAISDNNRRAVGGGPGEAAVTAIGNGQDELVSGESIGTGSDVHIVLANAESERWGMGNAPNDGQADAQGHSPANANSGGVDGQRPATIVWDDARWIVCRDGKARAIKPGIQPLVDGVSGRVGTLRGAGNAIVPQVAAEFIKAYMEAIDAKT